MSLNAETAQKLADIANKLRIHSVEATTASNSGHPSSCASMADITSVLFFHTMRYDPKVPRSPANDRFILSKGHAAPILYAAWAEAGLFPVSDLKNLRKIDCPLEGHPTPVWMKSLCNKISVRTQFYYFCFQLQKLNFVDVATGSLGQGLSCAAGMAHIGKYHDKAE